MWFNDFFGTQSRLPVLRIANLWPLQGSFHCSAVQRWEIEWSVLVEVVLCIIRKYAGESRLHPICLRVRLSVFP